MRATFSDRRLQVAYENRPEYLFLAGDCTKAYSPAKLELWVRQIVFLRPATFVILDRVVSTKPEYEKAWLLHMKNEPAIDGNTVTIQDGQRRLVSQTLLPERSVIRKVQGYTYSGQTFDEKESGLTPTAGRRYSTLCRATWGFASPGLAELMGSAASSVFATSPCRRCRS